MPKEESFAGSSETKRLKEAFHDLNRVSAERFKKSAFKRGVFGLLRKKSNSALSVFAKMKGS